MLLVACEDDSFYGGVVRVNALAAFSSSIVHVMSQRPFNTKQPEQKQAL